MRGGGAVSRTGGRLSDDARRDRWEEGAWLVSVGSGEPYSTDI